MDPRLEIRLENPTRKSDYSHASDSVMLVTFVVMLVIFLKNRPTTSKSCNHQKPSPTFVINIDIAEITAPISVTNIMNPTDILIFVSPV